MLGQNGLDTRVSLPSSTPEKLTGSKSLAFVVLCCFIANQVVGFIANQVVLLYCKVLQLI